MKSITQSILSFQMGALLLTAAFVTSEAGEKTLPFRGKIEANEAFTILVPPFNHFLINGSGTGTATHLGRFTVTYEWDAELGVVPSGSAEFIAANGDRLDTEMISISDTETADPLVHVLVETYTITGGTGRFAEATGTFTMERFVSLTIGEGVTDVTFGSFQGTIAIHKGN